MRSFILTLVATSALLLGGLFNSTAEARYPAYYRGGYGGARIYNNYRGVYRPRVYGSYYRPYYNAPYYGGSYYNRPYYSGYYNGRYGYGRPYYGGYYGSGVGISVGPFRGGFRY